MRGLRAAMLGAVVALTGAAGATPALAQGTCVSDRELEALRIRVVQTDAVVAAIRCNASGRYNEFVQAHQKELMAAHETLRVMFRRIHGRKGSEELTNLFTRFANEASARGNAHITNFCTEAGTFFDTVAVPGQAGPIVASAAVVHSAADTHGFVPCSLARTQTAAAGGAAVAPVAFDPVPLPKAKPMIAAAPAAAPAPAVAIPAAAPAAPATAPVVPAVAAGATASVGASTN